MEPDRGARAPGSRRRPGRRALRLAVAVVGSLLVAETSLQLAGLATRRLLVRGSAQVSEGEAIRILCVGDSHTFGLPLPEEESYPAQLEAALAARHPHHRFEVVNLGIPGLNSSFLVNRLERQLYQIRPQLVIVWVGINNLWNPVERRQRREDEPWLELRRQLMRLRLFRLASIAWYNATGHQYDLAGRGGWYQGELAPSGHLPQGARMPDPAPGLANDLRRVSELTGAADVPVIFVGYPLQTQRTITRVIEATGARLGIEVIDTARDLERAFDDGHTRSRLIDTRAGDHPSGLLYAYVVESMLPVVTRTLDAWHALRLGSGSLAGVPTGGADVRVPLH